MKNRTALFVLALCLVSSLSFAESAVDAPLVVSDPYGTAAQPDTNARNAKRHSDKKKSKDCSTQQAAQTKDKSEQPYQAAPSQAGTSPTM